MLCILNVVGLTPKLLAMRRAWPASAPRSLGGAQYRR